MVCVIISEGGLFVCDLGGRGKFSQCAPDKLESHHQHQTQSHILHPSLHTQLTPQFLLNPHSLLSPLLPFSIHNGLPHPLQSSPLALDQAAQRSGSQDLGDRPQRLRQTHGPRSGCIDAAAGARCQDHRLRRHEGGRLWYAISPVYVLFLADNVPERADWPAAKLQVPPILPPH